MKLLFLLCTFIPVIAGGCNASPAPALVTSSQIEQSSPATSLKATQEIEQLMRNYFDAFNKYDTDAVGKLLSDNTRQTEGQNILQAVIFAKGLNMKFEPLTISSNISGNTAVATVNVSYSTGTGIDVYNLVNENGWKIANKVATNT